MRALSIPKWGAIGILEGIWHFAADYTPEGDIGRYADDAIAEFIGWDHELVDGAQLVQALVDTHWLDANDRSRVVIHDWHDHAPEWVIKKLQRAQKTFVTGPHPRLDGVADNGRQRPTTSALAPEDDNVGLPSPDQTSPDQTPPDQTPPGRGPLAGLIRSASALTGSDPDPRMKAKAVLLGCDVGEPVNEELALRMVRDNVRPEAVEGLWISLKKKENVKAPTKVLIAKIRKGEYRA